MIEIKITDEMFLEAREKAISLGQLHNSITRGSGNLAGFIGEILVRTHFNYTEENTYDYDLVTEDGRKIDVKTKQTTVVPKSNYDCSISASNTKQKCDEYIFVRVKSDFSVGWILGSYNMKINQLKECL